MRTLMLMTMTAVLASACATTKTDDKKDAPPVEQPKTDAPPPATPPADAPPPAAP